MFIMPQLNNGNIYSSFDSVNSSSSLFTTALPLLPFQNQVGGHCSFFRFSKRAICKPMSKKEEEFYEYLEQHHVPLLPFTSQYLGVVNVTYRSSNAQPMLPEVILEENKHLLATWKNYCTTNNSYRQQQQQQQPPPPPPRIPLRRHSSSFTLKTRSDTFELKRDSHMDDHLETKPHASSWSPLTFKEQVLREVFSPDALEERLQQVQHWQLGMRQRQLEEDSVHNNNGNNSRRHSDMDTGETRNSSSPYLHISRSASDLQHQHQLMHPVASSDFETTKTNEFKGQHNTDLTRTHTNEPQVTVHPRKPSLIDSTTSAPQTPRMREAKLYNSSIRSSNQTTPTSGDVATPPPSLPQTHSQSDNIVPGLFASSAQQQQQHDNSPSLSTTTGSGSTNWRPRQEPTNPWSVQMYQRDLEKVNVDDIQQFILIEDLTDDIKYPCVLDLKMGVRQHSVFSSTKKMISQTKKCERSTSQQLGVRISGMQIYNMKTQQFLFEDKYMGRTLTPRTFRDSLVRYFDNGEGCHIKHLPTLIRKLALIHRIIKTMDAFRFYASSLLIIYDAAADTKPKRRIDVRLIDFAKSITKEEWYSQRHKFTYPPKNNEADDGADDSGDVDDPIGPDQGYLLGVRTLIACFFWIYLKYGGNKDDLMDLDDKLLSMDRLSWLDGEDDDTPNR